MAVTVYEKQAPTEEIVVFFTGATALSKGQGVCYDHDYGTATDADERRTRYVELPTQTNNLHFAGVVVRDYVASAVGQWIGIVPPGYVVEVLVTGSVSLGAYVTCIAGGASAGKFSTTAGYMGRGTAYTLQTVTGSVTVLAQLLDGRESGLIETITPVDNVAVAFMAGGVTLITGTITLGTGDSYGTLANGIIGGQEKGFACLGTLTTNDYKVIVTSGIQADDSTALVSMEFDAAAEIAHLTWCGDKWKVLHSTGTTLNAA